VPPGPLGKPHLRNVDGPLYHYARGCAVLQVRHRCLSLRGRPAVPRSLRRAMELWYGTCPVIALIGD